MNLPLLFAFTSAVFLILLALGYKHASVVKSPVGAYGSILAGIAFLITFGYSFFETSAWSDPRLWGIGLAAGALFIACIWLYTLANQVGPPSTSWPVLNLSCIVAIVLSVAILPGERFVWIDALIIAFFAGMIVVLNAGMKADNQATQSRVHPLFWPLVLTAFTLNGVFLFVLKIKEAAFPAGNNGATLALCYGSTGVALALCHLITCRRRNTIPWRGQDVAAGLMAGAGAGLGNIFVLKAMSLPAVVVLPICLGLPLIGGVVAMTLLYRERFNRAKVISLFIIVALLLLTIFRERM